MLLKNTPGSNVQILPMSQTHVTHYDGSRQQVTCEERETLMSALQRSPSFPKPSRNPSAPLEHQKHALLLHSQAISH